MKKLGIILIFLGLVISNVFSLEERGSATIYTTDGTTIHADEILVNFGKKWNISLEIDGERLKSNIDINTIHRLEIVEWNNEEQWWIVGKLVITEKTSSDSTNIDEIAIGSDDDVFLESTASSNGKEYTFLANPESLFQRDEQDDKKEYIVYKKRDPINDELVKNRIWRKSIKSIEFNSNKGKWKVDSKGNKFSPDYNYSPYTGEKLNFGN